MGKIMRFQSSLLNQLGLHHLVVLCLSLFLTACDGGAPVSSQTQPITFIEPLPAGRGLLPSLALADSAFRSDHYAGSVNCSICHDGEVMQIEQGAVSRNVSIGAAWQTSAMANATRDPYWHAVVAAELHRYPSLAAEINETCTVCHAPMAVDMARKESLPLQPFDTGSVEDGDFIQGLYSMNSDEPLYNHAMDGVSCSFCHQMADVNLGDESSFTGGYTILPPPAEEKDRPAYGQYGDPDVGYMRQQSGFTPIFGSHLGTSEACATCHNLTTHAVDTHGVEVANVPAFPEQTVFTEWQQSDYAVGGPKEATCQACHMPKLDQPVVLASAGSTLERENFSEHSFLAANTVLQDMLQNFSAELGVANDIDFTSSIERNRQFLQTAATLELQNTEFTERQLGFDVKIDNLTGHKLPSGYHSRRVYLHILVTNSTGELVFESGRINPDGSIAGVAEDTDSNTWELHYDQISDERQVQVYQSIMINSDGQRAHSLLNSMEYIKDNRLLPAGLDKVSADATIAVHGSASSDDDFIAGQDTVSYNIATRGNAPFNVLVELRYQPLSYGHLQDLFSLSDELDVVDMFRTLYESTNLRDEVIATGTATVP